jgi:hypothetical protein
MLAPALPNPASEAVEREVVAADELKVVGDKGFGGYGETMKYTFRKDGSIKQLRGPSGAKLVPIDDFTLPERIT